MALRETVGNYSLGNAATHIGKAGALAVDPNSGSIYVQNGVTPGTLFSGGSSVLVSRTVISSAQLRTSKASPIPLVDAPGAGKVLVILSTIYELIFGTVAYTIVSAGGTFYSPSLIAADNTDLGVFAGTVSQWYQSYPIGYQGTIVPVAQSANQSLVYTQPTSEMTGGNGTAVISVYYNIFTL